LEASLTEKLKLDDKGLIPAIVQDADSGEVLMLGYMNMESIELTLSSGEVWFYSRSRQELWHKGATSGNRLIVRELWQDCDSDAILVKAKPLGPVCHTGERTCFFQKLTKKDLEGSSQEGAG
jgi:phosphoribosyl-AMP cyclohydrolase